MIEELTQEERAERIDGLLSAMPGTQASLAERFGVSSQAINGWRTTGKIKKAHMARLAALAKMPVEYLIYRDWEAAVRGDEDHFRDIMATGANLAMGDGSEGDEYAEAYKLKFRRESLARKNLSANDLRVYYGSGDSMEPTLCDGDAIMFDASETQPADDVIFAIWFDGRRYVKRLRVVDDIILITSDNPIGKWRKQIRVRPSDDFAIEGKVKWIARWVQC